MKLARRVACLPWFFSCPIRPFHLIRGITKHPFFIAVLTPSACIEQFLPYIFLLILVEVLKDALQPYLLVQRYFVAASFSADSEEFIFRPVVFLRSTGTYKLRGSVPLSYTRAREIVLSAFDSIGLPKQDYGLHSLRAGGASAAANA